jgi:hypothetical protein
MAKFVFWQCAASGIRTGLLVLTIFCAAVQRSFADDQSPIEVQVVSERFICHHQGRVCTMVIDPSLATEEALTYIARSLEQQNSQYRYLCFNFYTDINAAQLRDKSRKTDEEADYESAHMAGQYIKNEWTSHNELYLSNAEMDVKVVRFHPEIEPTGGVFYLPCLDEH